MTERLTLNVGDIIVTQYVLRLDQARMTDVDKVGGKNASLGEMISQLSQAGVRVQVDLLQRPMLIANFLVTAVWPIVSMRVLMYWIQTIPGR